MNKQHFSRMGIGLPVPNTMANLLSLGKYIKYDGNSVQFKNNNYPQKLSQLASNSPTHSAALEKKSLLTYGKGISFEGLPEKMQSFLNDINEKHGSINELLYKISYDLPTFGGFALKVTWRFDRSIDTIEHVDFKQVRLGEIDENGDVLDYLVYNDWENQLDKKLQKGYRIKKFNPDMISQPEKTNDGFVADEVTLQNASQLIYFKSYSVGSVGNYYPVPDFIGCVDSILTQINVNVTMLQQMENGINGAYIISSKNSNAVLSEEAKEDVTDRLEAFNSGSNNAGSILFIPTELEISKLEPLGFELYKEVIKNAKESIASAHGIPTLLLEQEKNTGFSDGGNEIFAAYGIFIKTKIVGYQNQILGVLNSIMDFTPYGEFPLEIIPFLDEPIVEKEETESVEVSDEDAENETSIEE